MGGPAEVSTSMPSLHEASFRKTDVQPSVTTTVFSSVKVSVIE